MILSRLLFLFSICAYGLTASANHVLGGNITWECLGGNQYQITLTQYKDCYGYTDNPAAENFYFFPTGCASSFFSIDLSYVSQVEISDLCVTEFPNSSCSGGLAPGTMQVTFSGIVTLNAGCTWDVIWNNGSWNYFQNMDNVNGLGNPVDAYIHTEINTSAPCDNSIDITSSFADPAIEYACFGSPFCHQIDVANPNGYTLTYTLGNCLTTGATIDAPVNAPGIVTPAGVTISATGNLCWANANDAFGNYVFNIEILMMDGAIYIGTIYENVTVVVRNCAPTVTTFNVPNITSVGPETIQTSGTSVLVCAGDTLCFTVEANNPDLFRAITLSVTNNGGFASLPFVPGGLNPVIGTFKLATTGLDVGTHLITIHAVDDACPNPDTDDITITAVVSPNLELNILSDTVCASAPVTLTATGLLLNNQYSWSVLTGDGGSLPAGNTASKIVTPTFTTTYQVAPIAGVVVQPQCSATAQATVYVSIPSLTLTPTAETCNTSNGTIDLTVNGDGSGNYTYDWSGPLAFDPPGIDPQDVTGLIAGSYNVTVTDNVYLCSRMGATVVGSTPAPTISFTGGATICGGSTATLVLDLTAGLAPFRVVWVTNPLSGDSNPAGVDDGPTNNWAGLSDLHDFVVTPPSTVTYTIDSIIDASGCFANINLSQTVTVRPIVTAQFLPEPAICFGGNTILDIDHSLGGNYEVVYTSCVPLAGGTVTVGDLGTIDVPNMAACGTCVYDIESVSYTTTPTCPSTDAQNPPITVTVHCLPTATVTGGITVCNGACTNLVFNCTGMGPWVVNYTLNGVAQVALNSLVSPFNFNVCPTGTAIYCITSVSDANCNNPNNSLLNSCATVTALPAYTVVSFTATDYNLCPGECADITLDVSPNTGLYCVGITNTVGSPFCSQNPVANFSQNVCPDQTTTYNVNSLSPDGFPACAVNPGVFVTINVHDFIDVVQTSVTCNDMVTPYQYQVVYTLSDGNGVYTEAAGGNTGNFLPANTYTTASINTGTTGTWIFSDANNCNVETETITHNCTVTTNAGSMSNLAISVCGAAAAGGTFNNDQVLDGNDDIMWVLCTNPLNPLSNMVQIPGNPNCVSATFNFPVIPDPDILYGTTYYIVAVAGDAGGMPGCVVQTNIAPFISPYIDISNGQAVTWYEIPTATLSTLDNTVCEGQSVDLEIDFTGTGPWTFTVDKPFPLLDETITTSTNPYTLSVEDAGDYDLISVSSGPGNLCTGTVSGLVSVSLLPLPTAVFSGSDEVCIGEQHCFQVDLTGIAPWVFTVNDPDANNWVTPDPTNDPSYNLYCVTGDEDTDGNYFITSVTDGNFCSNQVDTPPITLTVNELPTAAWSQTAINFCEGSDADITLNLDGEAPFTPDFSAVPLLPETQILGTDFTYTVAVGGTYTLVTVTDGNDCVSLAGDAITVTEIPLPIADAGPDMEQCVGVNTIIGTAVLAGVSYVWAGLPDDDIQGSSTIAQPTVNAASAGTDTYTLTVTTNVGSCTAADDVDVTYFVFPTMTITADTDSLCAGDCAVLTVGGDSDNYVWDAADGTSGNLNQPSISVCPLNDETYTVTGTENHPLISCSSDTTISIYIGASLAVAEDFTEEICNGTCEGEIHLAISGGFSPYQVSGDILSEDEIELCPGMYNYTITDAIGCTLVGSIEIEERAAEVIDEIIVTQPICSYNLGSILVNDITTSINCQSADSCNYSLTLPGNSALFDELVPCMYYITTIFEVAPGTFCQAHDSVLIAFSSPDISLNPVWTEDIFCFEELACFDAVPTGGVGVVDIEWFDNEDCNYPYISTAEPYCIPMTEDIILYARAFDQLFCYSDTVMITATMFPDITLNLQNGADTVFICEYDCAELFAITGGGNGNVGVTWYELPSNTPPPDGNADTIYVCPFFDTQYYVEANDGCSVPLYDSIWVHVWDTPEVLFDADTTEGCYPLLVEFYDQSSPIADDVDCVWAFGNGDTQDVCGTVQYNYSSAALYAEYYPSLTITTEHGCVGSDTLSSPIILHGFPEIDFSWEPQPVTVLTNQDVQMINLTEGATSYFWNFIGSETSTLANPTHTFPLIDQGIYPICLTATTNYGCSSTLCQEVLIESVLQVFVPNTFTPDEDGINDIFFPVVTGAKPGTYKFWIFNRWGDQLFYTDDPNAAWTGGSDGGEYYVNTDTYVWRLEVEAVQDGKIEVYEGTVTILR